MNPSVVVYCTTTVEGFHRWPDAPDEVSHLRVEHRHLFGIRVEIRVSHDDRDVEFIIAKRAVDAFFAREPIRGTTSCEMIAKKIRDHLTDERGWDIALVEVNEDGENGAVVRWGAE